MDIVDIIVTAVAVGVLLFMIIGTIVVRRLEIKQWNNGYCRECGKLWIHFDTDSHGGRMYRCENWHVCIISYNIDKVKEVK